MDLSLSSRFKNAWNAFRNRAPTMMSQNIGSGYSYRPDRFRLTRGNERSIVTSVYNRIALDVAAINIQHVQLDDEGRFLNVIKSGLNECLSLEANLDQTGINTAEQFEGKTRATSDSKKKKLVAIIANLADYSLGATKGGEVTHFTQFDIDFNQEKSLLETRCSGALTRVYSAIAIEEDVTTASSGSEDHTV